MNVRGFISRMNRLQNDRLFKVFASVVVVLLGVAWIGFHVVRENAANVPPMDPSRSSQTTGSPTGSEVREGTTGSRREDATSGEDSYSRIVNSLLARHHSQTGMVATTGAAVMLGLLVIWLGLGMTYLGLGLAALALAGLISIYEPARKFAPLVFGVLALTGAFTAMMQFLRILYGGAHPVFAIARNVLAEAVRMKVSGIFILVLIFAVASLPGLLDPETPLRYRVQSFLAYAVGGSFWLIAILVLLFSAATVCFEQRDRVIWQTMTKPVAAWQYVLGKWLGVVGLAAVLLCVCGTGVFLFTEYLRGQPALGERLDRAYTPADGSRITEDRFILDTQVLVARVVKQAEPLEVDESVFEQNVRDKVDQELANATDFAALGARGEHERIRITEKLRSDLRKAIQLAYRAIEPGQQEMYTFKGLGAARGGSYPVILRYKINAGSNMPDQLYHLTFEFRGINPESKAVNLGQYHPMPLPPEVLDENGEMVIRITNADIIQRPPLVNPESISFPPDGLEVSYAVSGYHMNFVRVLVVLWIKLAFLAMVAICCATFVSFPVACLVSLGTFWAAEGAGFLREALENWSTEDDKGNVIIYKKVIEIVASVIQRLFHVYGELKPTQKLVEGVLLSWTDVVLGSIVLAVCTVMLYFIAVSIFKRRELATYSGH